MSNLRHPVGSLRLGSVSGVDSYTQPFIRSIGSAIDDEEMSTARRYADASRAGSTKRANMSC